MGIDAPKTPELIRKLRDVAELWVLVKGILNKAATGHVLKPNELTQIASLSERLLTTMNEAVFLYENE